MELKEKRVVVNREEHIVIRYTVIYFISFNFLASLK